MVPGETRRLAVGARRPSGHPTSHGRSERSSMESSVDDPFSLGQLIAGTPYRVRGLIGSGGMGSVYEVEHEELGKLFVLKALRPQLVARADLAARMKNEWRALGRLPPPNLIGATAAGRTASGVPHSVM